MSSTRSSRVVGSALLAAGLLLAVVGCGAAGRGAGSSSPAPGGSSVDRTTDLVLVVDDGRGTTTTWHLTCDPPGGDHPDPGAACAALAAGERWLPPVPAGMACTEIYGGPETATLDGTWRGSPLHATFARNDGCQIARWNGLAGLLSSGGM